MSANYHEVHFLSNVAIFIDALIAPVIKGTILYTWAIVMTFFCIVVKFQEF